MTKSFIPELTAQVNDFVAERDWEQFHSPKNLAMAMIVEAAELVEHFQWLTQQESAALDGQKKSAVAKQKKVCRQNSIVWKVYPGAFSHFSSACLHI